MNDFSLIPDDNVKQSSIKNIATKDTQQSVPVRKVVSFDGGQDLNATKKIEKNVEKTPLGVIFPIAIITFVGAMLFIGYLFFMRYLYIARIGEYSNTLKSFESSIDKTEIENYKILDKKLEAIRDRIAKHVILTRITGFVNLNLRSNVQISDYKVDVEDRNVQVTYVAISPSFKEMAEQAEKLITLKKSGYITSYSVGNVTYESETRRVKFTVKIIIDKAKATVENPLFNNKET